MHQALAPLVWATRIMFAKHTIPGCEAPFQLDLKLFEPRDYETIIPSLREVERRLKNVPADAQGMRWIHLGDTVLFYGERTFDVSYEDFISRVSIGHVGQFYRDSLSATTEVAERDELGRPVRPGCARGRASSAELHCVPWQRRVGRVQAGENRLQRERAARLDAHRAQSEPLCCLRRRLHVILAYGRWNRHRRRLPCVPELPSTPAVGSGRPRPMDVAQGRVDRERLSALLQRDDRETSATVMTATSSASGGKVNGPHNAGTPPVYRSPGTTGSNTCSQGLACSGRSRRRNPPRCTRPSGWWQSPDRVGGRRVRCGVVECCSSRSRVQGLRLARRYW